MSKKFRGVFTALVTPFNEDQSIDWDTFEKLVELQVDGGVAGIVPCGTTGESPTLSHDEHDEVIERVVKMVAGRTLVVGGTGSNSTAEAIRMSQAAEKAGVDGCLVVNPYYNKPTQEGLFRHFKAIADSVQTPIMLYNIMGRTGVNLETPVLAKLVEACPNVEAMKEASGDINQMRDVINATPDHFCVVSGDDNMTLELIKEGGDGAVSVASNLLPQELTTLVNAALEGDFSEAEALNNRLMPVFEGVFLETNPIPIKAAMAERGLCKEIYRLPLCEMNSEKRKEWVEILASLN